MPRSTQLLDLDESFRSLRETENAAGGLRLEYEGMPGDLTVAGGLFDTTAGYSAELPFGMRTAGAEDRAAIALASAGIMAGDADPAAAFPSGTRFEPYVVVRNTTSKPLSVKLRVAYMNATGSASHQLPILQLGRFESRYVRPIPSLRQILDRVADGTTNIVVTYEGREGDILLATGSTDQSSNYVLAVVPQRVATTSMKEAHYWKAADGFDTMFTLWNPAAVTTSLLATFHYGDRGQHYKLPVRLAPNGSTTIDITTLIADQRPDVDGNVIPVGTAEGSAQFSAYRDDTMPITVVISEGILNVRDATCQATCIDCCGYSGFAVQPSSKALVPGQTTNLIATARRCDGSSHQFTNATWTTNAAAVASVNASGLVTANGGGSATITARFPPLIVFSGQYCNINPTCPVGQPQQNATITVQVPTSLAVIPPAPFYEFQHFNDYKRIRVYEVRDQNNSAVRISGLAVNETIPPYSSNGCNLTNPQTQSAQTNSFGQFVDTYFMSGSPVCPSNPGCTSRTSQTIRVAGWNVRSNALTYRCDRVDVIP